MVEQARQDYEIGDGGKPSRFKKLIAGFGLISPIAGTRTVIDAGVSGYKNYKDKKEEEKDKKEEERLNDTSIAAINGLDKNIHQEVLSSMNSLASKYSTLKALGDGEVHAEFDSNSNLTSIETPDYKLKIDEAGRVIVEDASGDNPELNMNPATMGHFRRMIMVIQEDLDYRIAYIQGEKNKAIERINTNKKRAEDVSALINEHNNSEDDPDALLDERLKNNLT